MTMAKDPVCGMQVEVEHAQWKAEHAGETYYFCSPGCLKAFEQAPEKYTSSPRHGEHGHAHH